MATVTALLTADEYLATGDTRPRRTELVNGEVIVNAPSVRHQRIGGEIRYQLSTWCRAAPGRGEVPDTVDARLDTGNVLAGDVIWISDARNPGRDARWLEGPPDLVVEVRSPSTWRYDVGPKRAVYERAGLPELWLVDTESSSVLVYRRSSADVSEFDVALEVGRGDQVTSPMLPGFALDVTTLFER